MTTTRFPAPAGAALASFPLIFQDTEEALYNGEVGCAWAPGRVNLIGEHTDYNDGYVLPIAVDRVAAFAGRSRRDKQVRLWSMHFQEHARFALEGLPETFEQQRATLPLWARYVLGVITELTLSGVTLAGFDAVVNGDVPLGGGMSSSAALEVATAYACALFSQNAFHIRTSDTSEGAATTFSPLQIAALCQRAEQRASGVRSGILDQAASCLGQPAKAVLLDCRSLAYSCLPFASPDVSLVVIDTAVRRELASSAYNERRQQCEEATACLRELIMQHEPSSTSAQQITALRDVSSEQFERYKQYLPELLARRAGYVIAENARVLQVAHLLEAGRIEEVGPILWQGHAGLRDDYEVSSMELDTLVEIARQVPGVLGGRMMGGGFGGCTLNLVRNEAVSVLQKVVAEQYPLRTGRQASIDICRAAGGPGYSYV
jgi:galactokinase